MQKRLLITGGAGFIGSHLSRLSVSQGFQTCVIDALRYAGSMDNIADLANHKNFKFERVDLLDIKKVLEVLKSFKPDAILHLAAETHVDNSIQFPTKVFSDNVIGTLNLVEACKTYLSKSPNQSFKTIFVSTDEVFGALGPNGEFTETSPYDPKSPYSASKAACEHIFKAWHNTFGVNSIICRPCNNFGPNQNKEKLVPKVINQIIMRQKIPIYGSGKQVRDWIYVEDTADAILHVLKFANENNSFNIGAKSELTNIEMVKKICHFSMRHMNNGFDPYSLVTYVDDRPGHDFRYAIDPTKLFNELNWKPKTKFDDGLEKTVNWFFENHA